MQSGRVVVGALHTMGPVDLALVLAEFHRRYPAVELTVREQSSEELAEMLRVDELDLAFLSVTERIESHGLGLHQLVSEELQVILPCDHPLAGSEQIAMAQLANEQFISFRHGSRLRELLVGAGESAGFHPRIKLESNEARRIRRLTLRFCFNMAYRVSQFVSFIEAATTTQYAYYDGADPQRFIRLLQTGELEPDDATHAESEAGEDEVLDMIEAGQWEALFAGLGAAPARPAIDNSRRGLYRAVDRVRELLPRGDL